MMTWRPIESAPRDGTAFFGWLPDRVGYVARQDIAICYWSEWGAGIWAINGHNGAASQPTHWQPLPPPL